MDLVRSIDLARFAIPPGPKGEKPYRPHALFGMLAWSYLHGVRSSRKLACLADNLGQLLRVRALPPTPAPV